MPVKKEEMKINIKTNLLYFVNTVLCDDHNHNPQQCYSCWQIKYLLNGNKPKPKSIWNFIIVCLYSMMTAHAKVEENLSQKGRKCNTPLLVEEIINYPPILCSLPKKLVKDTWIVLETLLCYWGNPYCYNSVKNNVYILEG